MKEANVGKITTKFVVKLVIWFLLLYIVTGVIALTSFATGIEGADNDEMVLAEALNGFMVKLIIANIVTIILSVLLATRKIKKKFIINNENSKNIAKNIMIVLIVMTLVVAGIHMAVKTYVMDYAAEEADIDDVDEMVKDTEAYAEKMGLDMSEIEFWEEFKSFLTKTNVFAFDSVAFLVMIPVTRSMIVKKEEQTENV